MSRSGYIEDFDGDWRAICWRGAVASAIRGKRGQAFLRELLEALDAMPAKRLIAHELVTPEGEACAMGVVCKARGLDASHVEPEEPKDVAKLVGLARAMVCEVAYMNDEDWCGVGAETPEHRWVRMRAWVASQIFDRIAS